MLPGADITRARRILRYVHVPPAESAARPPLPRLPDSGSPVMAPRSKAPSAPNLLGVDVVGAPVSRGPLSEAAVGFSSEVSSSTPLPLQNQQISRALSNTTVEPPSMGM